VAACLAVRDAQVALRLFEGLAKDINFNIMMSPRSWLTQIHTQHQMETVQHKVNWMTCKSVAGRIIDRDELRRRLPQLNLDGNARHPVPGAFFQQPGGTIRHDAVAWGYARAADRFGEDIIENCEVTGFEQMGRGGRLTHVVISPNAGVYINQTQKGELVMGGALDLGHSYAQRGNFPTIERVVTSAVEMFPILHQLRLMRHWGGIVDIVPDSSPILGPTPVENLFINCGWGTGGFKTIPAGGSLLAHSLGTGRTHPLAEKFGLNRFRSNRLINEGAAAGIAH
jgi:sarcosine oxidase subunit beta